MFNPKKDLFLDLSKVQKANFISYVKNFILKKKSFDKNSLYEEFLEEQNYYIEISRPYFPFIEESLSSEKFLNELKFLISDVVFKEQQKEAQKPFKEKQKEFARVQRKKAQEIKMSYEKPSLKQLGYYKSLCKKYNLEKSDTTNLSKLDLRNMIQKIIEKNADSDTI